MNLALFDFDGTLTTKDSLGEFIKYAVGIKHYYFGLLQLAPTLIGYKLKLIDNSLAKEKLFRHFFANIAQSEFKTLATQYSNTMIDSILRDNIYQRFLKHIEDGDRVVLVSASMKCWLEPFAHRHKVELLSTELEFIEGNFSGYFATKNCHGIEKLNRVQKLLNLDDFNEIYTYGDSSGDDYILEIADHKTRV